MIDVGTALSFTYPQAVPGVDFAFEDANGDGVLEITAWNENVLGPQMDIDSLIEWATSVELDYCKSKKRAEITGKAIEEISAVYTAGIDGKDEFDFEVAKALVAIGQALGIQEITQNQKLNEVVRCGNKARNKQQEIEGASTVSEVEEVSWTDG